MAQPDGKIRRPYRVAITTNPAIVAVGHFQIAADYRFHPRQAIGFEYTYMTSALHQQISPDSIPDLFDSWLPASGHRAFLRYKFYPFFNQSKVRVSRFYVSAQFMYREIRWDKVPLSYTENGFLYEKESEEYRQGGRLDVAFGWDVPLGDYVVVGAFLGGGLGMEHVRQFNLLDYDVGGLFPPGQQFFNDEADYWRNLLDVRLGLAIGVTIP